MRLAHGSSVPPDSKPSGRQAARPVLMAAKSARARSRLAANESEAGSHLVGTSGTRHLNARVVDWTSDNGTVPARPFSGRHRAECRRPCSAYLTADRNYVSG